MAAAFQRDPGVVAYEAFTGIRNDIQPPRFGLTDLAVGRNIDIDESGGISRRAGRTRVYTGATHSLWSDGTAAFVVDGTNLKQLAADYTGTAIRTGLTPNARMSYVKINDRVYYSNGYETGVVQNGSSRTWGLGVPAMFYATPTAGAMPAGDYQFTMAFLRADGQQSGAGFATRTPLPANSGLVFNMPAPSEGDVVATAIYLSTPNGDVLYRAAIVGRGSTSFAYTSDTTELALPLDTQFLSAPPPAHLLGYFRGRVFAAVGDTLFYSEPSAYELFDLRRYLQFDSKITMFAPIEDRDNPGIYIGTEQSTSWIQGVNPDEFKLVPGADYGAIIGAMDMVDGAMFADHSSGARMLPMWLSTQGVCIGLPGGTVQNITRSKYIFTASGSGCALFKPDSTQAIFVANS